MLVMTGGLPDERRPVRALRGDLSDGPLSPAEDLETAITAAAQSQACGQLVVRIERGDEVVLQEDELKKAVAKCLKEHL